MSVWWLSGVWSECECLCVRVCGRRCNIAHVVGHIRGWLARCSLWSTQWSRCPVLSRTSRLQPNRTTCKSLKVLSKYQRQKGSVHQFFHFHHAFPTTKQYCADIFSCQPFPAGRNLPKKHSKFELWSSLVLRNRLSCFTSHLKAAL